MMRIGPCIAFVVGVAFAGAAWAGEYQASRRPDAPFAFTSMFGATFNNGSSLMREAVILNDPDCPVQISSTRTKFELVKSNFDFVAADEFETRKPVAAVTLQHIAYDVFGRYLDNLAAVDVLDRGVGRHQKESRWRSLGDLVPELLTTVTYVSRVRMSDGTQWVYDERNLLSALGKLQLEPYVGESRRSEVNRLP